MIPDHLCDTVMCCAYSAPYCCAVLWLLLITAFFHLRAQFPPLPPCVLCLSWLGSGGFSVYGVPGWLVLMTFDAVVRVKSCQPQYWMFYE